MASKHDPLSALNVVDRLEVGPARVERRRLSAPYKIVQGDDVRGFELQYSYEEDVFDPSEPAARNLAAMMAAQPALNYGLFSREIVFHGSYDDADRRFLRSMGDNTAREIYVKKFLEPNPFLVGDAARLPAVKRDSYLRAELVFPDEPFSRTGECSSTIGSVRHAVLSSGGKDSLLSFGLLREIGRETHPVFVNESGRHWFSAINAYRYLVENVPETARVWTNSDRLFTTMLRCLPFIRTDFANVRSNEYPIRLWTVAVFIFAALPILRKRGIGRLVIGDEYDTTLRKSYRGIRHYDGLYDQGRFFDDAMTRYYQQKQWGIAQFSILRPLSELLIQKTLAAGFPDLLRHQVSCHATHVEDGRARPCGQCEKCSRVVAMLTALGIDPATCGYSSVQVTRCLAGLSAIELHQERASVEHLAAVLYESGAISAPSIGRSRARIHPEVLKLRFDPDRSPPSAIPADLREPLYRACLRFADGAIRRRGKTWFDTDPLNDTATGAPAVVRRKPLQHLPERETCIQGEKSLP